METTLFVYGPIDDKSFSHLRKLNLVNIYILFSLPGNDDSTIDLDSASVCLALTSHQQGIGHRFCISPFISATHRTVQCPTTLSPMAYSLMSVSTLPTLQPSTFKSFQNTMMTNNISGSLPPVVLSLSPSILLIPLRPWYVYVSFFFIIIFLH